MSKTNLVNIPVLLLFILCASCKKDNDKPIDPPVTYDSYSALKTGNYWVYQLYEVDSNGNGPATNEFDSCYISKDTVIKGNTYYYKVSGDPNLADAWLRDSLHCIVDNYGAIHFSSVDFKTVFKTRTFTDGGNTEIMAYMSIKMADKDVLYPVPAGDFITSNFRTTFETTANYRQLGYMRYMHKRYAKNIGVVSETLPFFMTAAGYRERRLVRYHLN